MFVSIINDCRDENAKNRQVVRAASLFHAPVSFIGVSDFGTLGSGEIEAAGNLIDTLDAAGDETGVVLVNVAIRHGKGKKWPNGTPFGYFMHNNTIVIATIDGLCLSLAKKFNLFKAIEVFDIPTVMDEMIKQGQFDAAYRRLVVDSQFRSYEFIPRAAKWLSMGIKLPTETLPVDQVADMPACVWWTDNFGNCITSMLPEEIGHQAGKKIATKFGEITCYDRLKDVPNSEPGLIVGSSGFGQKRFVWLVIQGNSAAKQFGIKSGDALI